MMLLFLKTMTNYRHILIMASFDSRQSMQSSDQKTDEQAFIAQITQAIQLGADMIDVTMVDNQLLSSIEAAISSVQPRDDTQIYPPQIYPPQLKVLDTNPVVIHTLQASQELGAKIAAITQLSQQTLLGQEPALLQLTQLSDIDMAWACIKTLDALKRTP